MLYSFSSCDNSPFFFFLYGKADSCSGNPFLYQGILDHTHLQHLCDDGMILLINVIVMPSSFLMVCFVNDIALVINHKLILYSMSFLLS